MGPRALKVIKGLGFRVLGFRVFGFLTLKVIMGVSENRGPQYRTLNSSILIRRTPKQGTLIFGEFHLGLRV